MEYLRYFNRYIWKRSFKANKIFHLSNNEGTKKVRLRQIPFFACDYNVEGLVAQTQSSAPHILDTRYIQK